MAGETDVHPEVRRVWAQLQGEGYPVPSRRQMRDRCKEAGVHIANTHLTKQLQRLHALAQAATAAPTPGLALEAQTARDIAAYNRQAAAEVALDGAVREATAGLLTALVARVAHARAQQTLASRLGIPWGNAAWSVEQRLAAYVRGQLAAVLPLGEGGQRPLLESAELLEAAPTAPVTRAEVQAARGQDSVWVVYRGSAPVSWEGCERQPHVRQAQWQQSRRAFQDGLCVLMSRADVAVLHARYGADVHLVHAPVRAW